MILWEFFIEQYDWSVTAAYDLTCDDVPELLDLLTTHGCPTNTIKRIISNINDCLPDKGICFSNFISKKSLLVVGRASSRKELVNTLMHETFHLVMHIAERFKLDCFGEELAYLAGDLAAKQFEHVLSLLF